MRSTREILFLLAILFIVLVISVSSTYWIPINEGLSPADVASNGTIHTALNEYNTAVEAILPALTKPLATISGITPSDLNIITGIMGNTQWTNTYKLQQLHSQNPPFTTPGVVDAINGMQGQKYSYLLKLLQTVSGTYPNSKASSDVQFNNSMTTQLGNINNILDPANLTSPIAVIKSNLE